MKNVKCKHAETLCAKPIHAGLTTDPHQMPLYLSSTFSFDSIGEGIEIFSQQPGSHVYTRYGNPTIEAVAQRIADLEVFNLGKRGYGLMTSSGMAAVHVVLQSILKPGNRLVTQGNLYGGTAELIRKIFVRQGISCDFIDFNNNAECAAALNKDTHVIFAETPANPTLACIDISKLANYAKQNGAILVVDNTFCTPFLQQPFAMGADVVIHSTTKFLHGHGASTAGVVVSTDKKMMDEKFWPTMKLAGNNCNPFDAWLVNLGLKTLAVRMERQSANASAIAQYLSEHKYIKKVNYPFLKSHGTYRVARKQMKMGGAVLSFELQADFRRTLRFIDTLKQISIAPSLGETDTMLLHPASMSHLHMPAEARKKFGVSDSLIRLSVGLESKDDLLEWIENGLQKVGRN